MITLLGLVICLVFGFGCIRFLKGHALNPILTSLFGLSLGLGLAGQCCFYIHILGQQFYPFIPILILLAGIIFFAYKKLYLNPFQNIKLKPPHAFGFLTLIVLAIPLIISAHYYPLGGWDAWSCWNLKAKFIFLGQEHWKDMLTPGLWRSNTQYPLLLPLINVWFFDLGGHFNQDVPMYNSVIFTLLTSGILLFTLYELTGSILAGITASILFTALPFNITLSISQYSDILLGLYLISAFACLLLAEKYQDHRLKILSMIFLGLMSFTKTEGLVLAGLSALFILWQERKQISQFKNLILTFCIAALPTIIFTLWIAPKNEAFINGLLSATKPTDLNRWIMIAVFPWMEWINFKWNGLWILILVAGILSRKKLWQGSLKIIGLSLILYLGIVFLYYGVNTFFEIQWWMQNTLSRILYALIPTLLLWLGTSLINSDRH